MIVVRGKGAVVPDTYHGSPLWQPPGQFAKVALRYWSLCNNNQEKPYPVVQCAADFATTLDAQGFYTYVVSADESGTDPPTPPAWIPAGATWLPWGATDVANVLIFRNMLPAPTFHQSVQAAEAAGCVFDNSTTPVPYDAIVAAGECARGVMGAYYPRAVYCDKQVLIDDGWQGCFAAAGVPVP